MGDFRGLFGDDAPHEGCSITQPEERGVTLQQLRRLAATAADASKTLHDVLNDVIKPATQQRKCSLVELVATSAQRPQWFVVHFYGTPMADLLAALSQHATDHSLGEDTPYWLCACALSPHGGGQPLSGATDTLPFVQALKAVQGVVSVIDREGEALQRAWTGFELYLAFTTRGRSLLHDIYAVAGDQDKPVGLVDGYAAIDNGLAELKAVREKHFPEELALRATRYALGGARTTVWPERARMLERLGPSVAELDATVRARFGCVVLPRLAQRAADETSSPELRLREALAALRVSHIRKVVLHEVPAPLYASALGGALPRVLEELELLGVHASVLPGVVECIRSAPLRQVMLLRCGIGDKEAASLADAIASSTALEALNLECAHTRPRTPAELARAAAPSRARALPDCRAERPCHLPGRARAQPKRDFGQRRG